MLSIKGYLCWRVYVNHGDSKPLTSILNRPFKHNYVQGLGITRRFQEATELRTYLNLHHRQWGQLNARGQSMTRMLRHCITHVQQTEGYCLILVLTSSTEFSDLLSATEGLERVTIFENFNQRFPLCYLAGFSPTRTINVDLGKQFARSNIDVESLSVSFMVDAEDFLSAPSSSTWPNPTCLVLTS